jgi:DNA-binding MarR family transcriptional regulator
MRPVVTNGGVSGRAGQPGPARQRTGPGAVGLGAGLRQAWVGYQRLLDEEMAAAGFPDRRFPDGRVLRMCARSGHLTASQIGRELGITRQGARKIVAGLRDRGYVTLEASATDRREKAVALTSRARDYLEAQRDAARHVEKQLEKQLGPEVFESLFALLGALSNDQEQPPMRDYLRSAARLPGGTERF